MAEELRTKSVDDDTSSFCLHSTTVFHIDGVYVRLIPKVFLCDFSPCIMTYTPACGQSQTTRSTSRLCMFRRHIGSITVSLHFYFYL